MQAHPKQTLRTVPPAASETGGVAHARAACWSCKGPVGAAEPFCSACGAVQPPGQVDHFTRLGLGAGFGIDVNEVDRRYFDLQRRLHPDRFATKTPRERVLSQQQATSLNEAYETLKDPLKRSDYLLKLHGMNVLAEGCNLVNDPELLMEAMERREALADAETPSDVDAIVRETRADIDECVAGLGAAFRDEDNETAGRLTTRLKYLQKLADETRVRKLQLSKRG